MYNEIPPSRKKMDSRSGGRRLGHDRTERVPRLHPTSRRKRRNAAGTGFFIFQTK